MTNVTRMERRTFLRGAVATGAAIAAGSRLPTALGVDIAPAGPAGPSILDRPANQSPIDHIVVLMMENRSFDHYLGWLATDAGYLEQGRRFYGPDFTVNGDQTQSFVDPDTGQPVDTFHLPSRSGEINPFRGCGHPDPGHGWDAGRAQRDGGFLADGSGNDEFALGYYKSADVPIYARLAKRFTTFDRYHCSLLGPTFPNREYMHSAQSGGIKDNSLPPVPTGFQWETIWDRLAKKAPLVTKGYYFVDLPAIALWGPRLVPYARHLEMYFADCLLGTLPQVTYVDPGFTTGLRTDDHPHADIRAGQKLVFDIFKAFRDSRLWKRGAFFLTYDEWGGFFDHVAPPLLADPRTSTNDQNNFAQAGFRVPTVMASPYARRNFVDHRVYDHTSILRFIEWRFLGAPAEGPGGSGWWLTSRDRNANNIGASLRPNNPEPDVDLDILYKLPLASLPCEGDLLSGIPGAPELPLAASTADVAEQHAFEQAMHAGHFERLGYGNLVDLRPLPVT
jgi:phospholipase C